MEDTDPSERRNKNIQQQPGRHRGCREENRVAVDVHVGLWNYLHALDGGIFRNPAPHDHHFSESTENRMKPKPG
jgi:hypothetical protein